MQNSQPRPSHPSPDRVRSAWMNLNGEWDFSFEEGKYESRITVPFSWCAPLSGIADSRRGTGYYRKTVRYDAGNDRLFLIFGAVDYEASVSVNGIPVGTHFGGYNRFEFDVTDAWDSFGDNRIEVRAIDTDEQYQTYGKQGYGNARGIWQTVWLERRPAAYIDSFVIRTKLDGTVSIRYTVAGETTGADVASAVFAGQKVLGSEGIIAFKVENPRLWTPDDPYLYEGKLIYGNDEINTYFGIREISASKSEGGEPPRILLNGKPIFLSGVLDQSFNPKGFFTLPTDSECEEEILRLKRIGINLARIHIKSEEPLKLYYADRHGLLLMEDLPCFWGEPNEKARTLFEEQMQASILRDINHPSIIYWVVFNETWGLFTKNADGEKQFLPETQEWVRACYRAVKEIDPTRLVEDNSPCHHDHVETDVLTWHFYTNGYRQVKAAIDTFCAGAIPGSTQEYIGGNQNRDLPAMNSECGNVWGILDGGAGDSDLSWHYHYMMNEFRLHERLCGFVFTEFHDVINEFNGYYRIDNTEKVFGYDGHCPGMTLRDLHGSLFLAYDCPPMQKAALGSTVQIPLYLSCFEPDAVGKMWNVRWEVALTDRFGQTNVTDAGTVAFRCRKIGLSSAGRLSVKLPVRGGIATLRLRLTTPAGEVKMNNFVLFDLPADDSSVLQIPVSALTGSGFRRSGTILGGEKFNGTGAGSASFTVRKSDIPDYQGGSISILFEAAPREELTKDLPDGERPDNETEGDLMLGYKVDRGANPNCFYMTDETLFPGTVSVSADGMALDVFRLPDSPADSRGCLSHFYQPADDRLEEVGSYGYLCHVVIRPEQAAKLGESFRVTLTADHGLSVFGRLSGRYPIAIQVSGI